MTVVELGGPKSVKPCSALRVRRLVAGELTVDESAAVEEHLSACARCRAVRTEVEGEKRALAEAVPFDAFAAGVAEKLAQAEAPGRARARPFGRPGPWWVRAAGAAAGLAAAAGVLFVILSSGDNIAPELHAGRNTFKPTDTIGALKKLSETRTKGGAGLSVFAVRAARTFALRAGEPTEQGDRLLPSLEPAGHAFALVALVEPGEVSVLFMGPAHAGPLPEAFEWTGSITHARIAAVYADAPLDEAAVVAALRQGSPAIAGAEIVFHGLERKGAQTVPR